MRSFLVNLSRRFPKNGYPCRYDFWLWILIGSIPLINFLFTGHFWPK